jgi:tRNA (guanine37-N1)-methyltransferase
MIFHIITIFPNIFDSYFNESILKRAQKEKLITINTYDLRNWTEDKHKTVDDTPYGGGAGMLMKIEPLYKAIRDVKQKCTGNTKVVLMSAKGKTWNQQQAKDFSKIDNLIIICGRYEGVDDRINHFIDEEISIGDYVLTGGEIGALVLTDSIARLLPGVLGNDDSSVSESHSTPGVLEYPQYTKPSIFEADGKKYSVPDVLLSGNHAEIDKWRKNMSKNKKK